MDYYEQQTMRALNSKNDCSYPKISNPENIKKIYDLFINDMPIDTNEVNDDDELAFYSGYYHKINNNYKNATKFFEMEISKENSNSLYHLACIYQNNDNDNCDYEKARKLYEMLIDKGNTNAMYGLARMYEFGKGVPKDYKKAFELLETAAKKGNSHAMNFIGLIYYEGRYFDKNYNKAFEYFEIAAQNGHSSGMVNLAHLYEQGQVVAQDYDKVIELFGMSIQIDNSIMPAHNLERIYKKNITVNRNLIVKHLVTYCENTNRRISYYIDLNNDDNDIVWETYLHKYWPIKNDIKNKIYTLLFISKNRNISKIDMKWMVKGITMIIIKYVATFGRYA